MCVCVLFCCCCCWMAHLKCHELHLLGQEVGKKKSSSCQELKLLHLYINLSFRSGIRHLKQKPWRESNKFHRLTHPWKIKATHFGIRHQPDVHFAYKLYIMRNEVFPFAKFSGGTCIQWQFKSTTIKLDHFNNFWMYIYIPWRCNFADFSVCILCHSKSIDVSISIVHAYLMFRMAFSTVQTLNISPHSSTHTIPISAINGKCQNHRNCFIIQQHTNCQKFDCMEPMWINQLNGLVFN